MTYPFVFRRRSKADVPRAVDAHLKKPDGIEEIERLHSVEIAATGNPDDFDVAAIIDWFGPYDSKENAARAAGALKISKGFYLVAGKRKLFSKKHKELGVAKRGRHLQYIGISGDTENNDVAARLRAPNHKIRNVTERNVEIWIGQFAQLDVLPNKKQQSTDLDQCEWALIHFLKPLLNEQKNKGEPPEKPVFLLSRWFEGPSANEIKVGQDFKPTRPKGSWWPDIIEYREDQTASMCWLGGKPRIEKRDIGSGKRTNVFLRRRNPVFSFAGMAVLVIAGLFGVNTYLGQFAERDVGEFGPPVDAELDALVADSTIEQEPVGGPENAIDAELEAQLQEVEFENDNLLADLTAKESEITWLKSETQRLQETFERNRTGGLDKKPCWGNAAERKIDYIYRVTVSGNGLMVQPAFPNKLQQAYDELKPENLVFDEPISVSQFREALAPIYQKSVENDCRHFVLFYDGEQNDLTAYKAQRDAVESYFYIFRPRQG